MAVSAINYPVKVEVTENGVKGKDGVPGVDGAGLNSVDKLALDNPVSWLYKTNRIVDVLTNVLTIERAVAGSYVNIYGVVTASDADKPRQEAEGWLITDDETDTFDLYGNVPLLDDGFSLVLELGFYIGGSVSQNILSIPAATGDVFTIGTDASDNWVTTIQGSNATNYSATTTESCAAGVAIVTYSAGTLNLYIDNVLKGTVLVAPLATADMDLTGVCTISGDFTLNIKQLRFYDFTLSADQITYLTGV